MEFDSHKNYVGEGIEDGTFENLLSQCGLKAIIVLTSYYYFDSTDTDIYGDSFWDISQTGVMRSIRKLDRKFLQSLLAKKKMGYKDIVIAMKKVAPDKYPDFRYNNTKNRDTKGKLFHSHLNGITAMKFERTHNLHWAVLFNGQVFPLISSDNKPDNISYDNMEKLRDEIKNFDGFGHTIIYRSLEDIAILKHFKQCSKLYCQDCIRLSWCPQK